jgi:hypothetical protein
LTAALRFASPPLRTRLQVQDVYHALKSSSTCASIDHPIQCKQRGGTIACFALPTAAVEAAGTGGNASLSRISVPRCAAGLMYVATMDHRMRQAQQPRLKPRSPDRCCLLLLAARAICKQSCTPSSDTSRWRPLLCQSYCAMHCTRPGSSSTAHDGSPVAPLVPTVGHPSWPNLDAKCDPLCAATKYYEGVKFPRIRPKEK